jgi:hypothetical protein
MDTLSLYSISIPVMIKNLKSLKGILDKAAEHAKAKSSERQPFEAHFEQLMNARLIFDQFPLIRQIQIATDIAKGTGSRLSEVENPVFADTEKTLEEVIARVDNTVKFLESLDSAKISANTDLKITLEYFPGKFLTPLDYLTEFALPNFYFHITMAYAILRKNGVDVGKNDFLGDLPLKDL